MTEDSITFPRRLVNLGVLLTLLPALGFLLAYLYEVAYLDVFQIEAAFAEVDITGVVAVSYRFTAYLVVATIFLQTVSWGVNHFAFRAGARMYYYALGEALFMGMILYWASWGFDLTRLGRAALYVLVIALVIGFFLRVIVRLSEGEDELSLALKRVVDSGYFPCVAGVVLLGAGASWLGAADATKQKTFLVAVTDPTIVVVRQYGDRAVAVRRVAPGLVSEEERILLRLAEGEAAHLKLAAIGPLRVRQPPRVSRGPSRPPSVEPVTPTADR